MKLTKEEIKEVERMADEFRLIWEDNFNELRDVNVLFGRGIVSFLAKQVLDRRNSLVSSEKTLDSRKSAEGFYRERVGWGGTDYLGDQCINPSELFELMDAYADQKYGK